MPKSERALFLAFSERDKKRDQKRVILKKSHWLVRDYVKNWQSGRPITPILSLGRAVASLASYVSVKYGEDACGTRAWEVASDN